jgi:hypothetical protein
VDSSGVQEPGARGESTTTSPASRQGKTREGFGELDPELFAKFQGEDPNSIFKEAPKVRGSTEIEILGRMENIAATCHKE